MKNQSKAAITKIKTLLEQQKEAIEKQLTRLKREDPFLAAEDRSHLEEPGTVAMEEEGHTRVESTMKESEKLLAQIKKALAKIGVGKYGICENCGNAIEEKRLAVFPMATLCLSCEKKKEQRSS